MSSIFSDFLRLLSTTRTFLPAISWSNHHVLRQQQSQGFVQEIVSTFLDDLNYHPPDSDAELRKRLSHTLRSDFAVYNDNSAWFEKVCAQASAMAELSYPGHAAKVQLQIARFTWFMLYLDDLCHKFPSSLERFQRHVLTSDAAQAPILRCFQDHLTDMYHSWDAIPANCIILSAMEYVNGCALEEMPAIRGMELSNAAHSWPYYLRAKTGVAGAYSFMIFPMDTNPDISVYIQVIGDISLFIDLTNDILSFYKEHLAGETNNYVHNRAYVTQKSIYDTLRDVARDALAAHARVTRILQSTDAYNSWKSFVNGYLAFHVTQERYLLCDLGF
ncbi:isoprenoid synthase domain-containing protein [Lyophyllum atratum]|nr:isoprenoid synthase domain-containing protein [Lyophyllum atratum]